ncbi:ABC transporter permease [Clostridium sp. 1001275B_160808_H3]|uniref:ABC transporter permease n=1 Tax=Clostridium sp. 1001275B_160808_H3 TaxID=2787110 RepID=UPI00189C2967|nr:ABC transporter permease [Clostridium sp. 1001275B_160808_H3]
MISIIKAVIINCIRDKKNHLFMIFFPLFLILLIGSTVSSYFNSTDNQVVLEDVAVYYLDDSSEKIKEVFNTFKNIEFEDKNNIKLTLKEIDDIEVGKKEVKVNRAILLHLKQDTIEFYSNSQSMVNPSFVYGLLNSIADRYNTITEVYSINPGKANEIVKSEYVNNFVEEENIAYNERPDSMDYYGVAEIGLMIFYFVTLPLYNIKNDRKNSIKDRINLSGISTSKYYFASFLGFLIYSFGTLMITYILSNIIFDINYGRNLLIVPLAMIPFLIIVIGIGIIVPMIFKEEEVSGTIIQNVIIPVLTFLGGGYIALDDNLGGLLNIVTSISPLRWFNISIFRYIYSGDSTTLIRWLLIGAVSLIIIISIICIVGKRSDRINEKYISIN